jgi:hypothetical protein
MARFRAAQWAVEDAIDDHMGIFRRGTECGPRLAHLAVGLLRSGYPYLHPWLTDGTVATSKKPEQAVWIEHKLTQPGRKAFFDEWYEAVRNKATMAASWEESEPFMSQREFVTALLQMANSIVSSSKTHMIR